MRAMASSENRVSAASGQFEVVGDVVAGVGLAHGRQGVAQRDALVEGGEGAEAEPLAQGGLADEDERERGWWSPCRRW